MAPSRNIKRYRTLYARLLRLYPRPFRERFAEPMAQTFGDLCRERQAAGGRLLSFALATFGETTAGIVRERMVAMSLIQKKLLRLALVTAAILLVPLVAMRFTGDVNWTPFDFLVAGVLIFGSGLCYELVARRSQRTVYRSAVALAVIAAFLLTWSNLAVGIIGSEDNPANLMYFGVPLIGGIGAFLARFRPRGMARALLATALAQILVPVIALLVFRPQLDSPGAIPGLVQVLGINVFFSLLFAGSALLFRHVDLTEADQGGGGDRTPGGPAAA